MPDTIDHTMLSAAVCGQPLLMEHAAIEQAMAMVRATGKPLTHTPRTPEAIVGSFGLIGEGSHREQEPFVRMGRAAIISVDGPIFYTASIFAVLLGGMSNRSIIYAAQAAQADPDIDTVVLDLHTPGGESAGMSDLMTALRELAGHKTLVALVHDKAASAGYWLTTACELVVATPSSSVGSIGTILLLHDESKAYEKMGVRPVVITDAAHKALGNPGVAIDETMIAREAAHIGAMSVDFRRDVSRKTGIGEAEIEAMQGAMYHARQALEAGLVDRVMPSAEFYRSLESGELIAPKQPNDTSGQAVALSTTTETPTMASVDEMYEQMSDEDKKEMQARLNAELEPESSEETDPPADEEPENAEPPAKDEPESATPPEKDEASNALSVHQARAVLADFGMPKAVNNDLIVLCMEEGWSENTLLRKALIKSREPESQASAEIAADAAGSADAVGGAAASATSSAATNANDEIDARATAMCEQKGDMTHAQARREVLRQHPELRDRLVAEANA